MQIPKLGETRCYWTLLNANLQFLFLDPVLRAHMREQADELIGHSLIEFVHPDERANATVDLHDVVEKRALHGTITRVKYIRASQIRVILGSTIRETFPHAAQIGFDENYLPCDIVMNWVAESLVLCFIHAIIDVSPSQDNDMIHKSHWTNWCGTVTLTSEDAATLYNRLFKADLIAPSPSHFNPHRITDSTSPTRIFQILTNSPARNILFSWPAENYYPQDFGRLAGNVRIDTTAAPPSHTEIGAVPNEEQSPTKDDGTYTKARTSCQKRYGSMQSFQSNGIVRDVESVFIPHGCVIFACHHVLAERPLSELIVQASYRPYVPYASISTIADMNAPGYPMPQYTTVQAQQSLQSQYQFTDTSSIPSPSSSAQSYPPSDPPQRQTFEWPTQPFHDDPQPPVQNPYPREINPSTSGIWSVSDQYIPDAQLYNDQYHIHSNPPPPIQTSLQPSPHDPSRYGPEFPFIPPPIPSIHVDQTFGFPSGEPFLYQQSDQESVSPSPSPVVPTPPEYAPPQDNYRPPIMDERYAHLLQGPGPSLNPHLTQYVGHSGQVMNAIAGPSDAHLRPQPIPPAPRSANMVNNSSSSSLETNGKKVVGSNTGGSGTKGSPPKIPAPTRPQARSTVPSAKPSTASSVPTAASSNHTALGQGLAGGNPKPSGHPPSGVSKCALCGTTSSPEWRKGKTGIKDLCNACGLRYARTKQKEEGYVPSRRRQNTNGDGTAASGGGSGTGNPSPASKILKKLSGPMPRGTVTGEQIPSSMPVTLKRPLSPSAEAEALLGEGGASRRPSPRAGLSTSNTSSVSRLAEVASSAGVAPD